LINFGTGTGSSGKIAHSDLQITKTPRRRDRRAGVAGEPAHRLRPAIDYRWGVGDAERIRRNVMEVLALAPEVILVAGGRNLSVLQQANRTIPVVFVTISDPVSSGFVESMARPGGNATGFSR
jgi:ABC-type uncharacterized transport system substrate-binding protein